MNEREMLSAISDMLDEKLNFQIGSVKKDIHDMKNVLEENNARLSVLEGGLQENNARLSVLEGGLQENNARLSMLEGGLQETNAKLSILDDRVSRLNKDVKKLNDDVKRINITLENEIRPNIKILAESYLPAATRYERSTLDTENLKTDVEMLKKVVAEHSEKLKNIS